MWWWFCVGGVYGVGECGGDVCRGNGGECGDDVWYGNDGECGYGSGECGGGFVSVV